jgi:hypothetical protein
VDGTQNVKLLAATRCHAVLSDDPGSHGRCDPEDAVGATEDAEGDAEGCAHPAIRSTRSRVTRRGREIIMVAVVG